MLPLLCQCLPVFEEFCCRFIKFVQKFVTHDSALIRFVAGYGVQYERNDSCLDQNVLFCMRRFQIFTDGIVCDNFSAVRLVNLKYMESVSDELERSVDMLRGCVRIREGQLTLPGEFCNAVNDIICFLCTD